METNPSGVASNHCSYFDELYLKDRALFFNPVGSFESLRSKSIHEDISKGAEEQTSLITSPFTR